jgi:hypothetical protein
MTERHKGCVHYKDTLVAPNKNPDSLYMLLQDPKADPRKVENVYKAANAPFMENWKKSGVDLSLMNYRVGDDPRWKTKEE